MTEVRIYVFVYNCMFCYKKARTSTSRIRICTTVKKSTSDRDFYETKRQNIFLNDNNKSLIKHFDPVKNPCLGVRDFF